GRNFETESLRSGEVDCQLELCRQIDWQLKSVEKKLVQEPDYRHRRLLRARREWPRRRATEERDERAAPYVKHGALPSSRGCQPGVAVTLGWDYTHRSMTRRIRIEYSTTHTTSEGQPRLSFAACSLTVDSPWVAMRHAQPAIERPASPWGRPELF